MYIDECMHIWFLGISDKNYAENKWMPESVTW